MVFIEDNESVFEANIDKVWVLSNAHFTDASTVHPTSKNVITEKISENIFINKWQEEIEGQEIEMEIKATIFYPIGIAFEILEGPFIGSKYFIYYIPLKNENKTKIVVTGEFKSIFLNEQKLKESVFKNLQKVFDEDCKYLTTIK